MQNTMVPLALGKHQRSRFPNPRAPQSQVGTGLSATHVYMGNGTRKAHILTLLSHARQVVIEATFVLDKRSIALLVQLDPVADVGPQLEVVRRRAVQLVRQGPEEAVAIADGVGSVEAELAQLGIQQLAVLFRVGHDGLVAIRLRDQQKRERCTITIWRLTLPLLLVVRDRTSARSASTQRPRGTATYAGVLVWHSCVWCGP